MDQSTDRFGWLFTNKMPSAADSPAGLSCCDDIHEALCQGQGSIVCRVADGRANKHVVWAFDADLPLQQFACRCAELAVAVTSDTFGWEAPAELKTALTARSRFTEGLAKAQEVVAARQIVARLIASQAAPGNSDAQAQCISEALAAAAAAVGSAGPSGEYSVLDDAREAFEHCRKVLATVRAQKSADNCCMSADRQAPGCLKELLEKLLVDELSFCTLRTSAAGPRTTPGAKSRRHMQ